MSLNGRPECLARGIWEWMRPVQEQVAPPFSCICTPRYYYDRNFKGESA